jgi:hypothetical protein
MLEEEGEKGKGEKERGRGDDRGDKSMLYKD